MYVCLIHKTVRVSFYLFKNIYCHLKTNTMSSYISTEILRGQILKKSYSLTIRITNSNYSITFSLKF